MLNMFLPAESAGKSLVQFWRVLKDEKGASRQALRPRTSFNLTCWRCFRRNPSSEVTFETRSECSPTRS